QAGCARAPRKQRCPEPRSKIVIQRQGSVIREALLAVDGSAQDTAGQRFAEDVIVDAPTHVLGPRLPAVRPPGVLVGFGVDLTETVYVTAVREQSIETGALFR